MDETALRGILGEPAELVKGRSPTISIRSVNGRARIVDDPDLLADSAVDGRTPRLGSATRWEIGEVRLDCGGEPDQSPQRAPREGARANQDAWKHRAPQ